jgi:AraC-like DNA-binding protein
LHPEIEVGRASWDLPIEGSEPGLLSILESHARSQIEALPAKDEVVAQVREAISGELRGGDPSIGRIAKKLATSERTLQRRLGDAGTSYAALLDGVRLEWAKTYLEQADVGLCEVSWLLGFSEQSAFTRAFKRWTGMSPGRFRQQLAAHRGSR